MEVSYNDQSFEVAEEEIEEIEYFNINTPKVNTESGKEIYWCPYAWDWRSVDVISQMERRYRGLLKTIYFNEKVFLVEKKAMRKHFKDGMLVDVCLLPIGIYVYWDAAMEQWDFLGYK